jgi:uncharacterized protein with PQ loop repeat
VLPVSVVVLVGCAATLVSLFSVVPQVRRAARTGSAEGVSWSSILLSMATFTLWCVYALAVADAIQVINNSIALFLLVALAVVVMRAGVPRKTWTPVAAIFASGLFSVLLVDMANSFTLAMVGTTVSSLRMLPQTRLALAKAPLWGLCPWSTVLAWAGAVLWLGYAVLVVDHAFALCSAIMLVMQTVILVHRLPLRRTLASLAGGRLGDRIAGFVLPISMRLPERQEDYELAA